MHDGRLPFASGLKTLSPLRLEPRSALRGASLFVVLLLSLALAMKWAFVVPIFQNPDEGTHADYAFSLMDTRRLLPVAPDPNLRFVDPLTSYIQTAVSSPAIAFHPGEIVEPAYGTPEMFRAIDNGLPIAAERAYQARPESTHLRYPVLYYGMIAATASVVRSATHSMVASFFAMRLFGVALLAITLACGFALLRLSGFDWFRAIAVTAIVGLLPEQSFLAASIQPDNLAETAVTATLLLAALFRRKPSWKWFMLTALGFGVLYMTKIQYFVAVAIPVALLFLSIAMRRRMRPTTIAFASVAFAFPTIGWFILKTWMSRNVTIAVLDPFSAPAAHVAWATASQAGPLAIVAHAADETLRALRSFYFDGAAARSFWGIFGWMDTPLSIGNETWTTLITSTIRYATVVIMAAVCVSSIVLLVRIIRRVVQRRFGRAFAIFVRDPMIFAVVLFSAIMLMLWLRWDDFGFQGRYWLPLSFPIWYVVFTYAPALLRSPRLASRVSTIGLVGVLLVVNIEASFALPTIVQRYYLASHFAVPYRNYFRGEGQIAHTIEIATIDSCPLLPDKVVTCPSGTLYVGGWAIPGGRLDSILLTLDGNRSEVRQIERREDVAHFKGVDPQVGFELRRVLTPGRHRFFLSAVSADGLTAYRIPERYEVVVTPQP